MGCCDSNAPKNNDSRETVRAGYARIAETGSLQTITGGCCGSEKAPLSSDFLAEKLGYETESLQQLPEGANMGLSCGNPTAIASLEPGQVVIDLGSGGGFDCFLAGPKVGAMGRVIGIDMTPQMVTKARQNTDRYQKAFGFDNVEFRLGEIEHLPVADNTADVVISNCVINLSPDKQQVWNEIARVLKPGGRAVVSDMALFKELPPAIRAMETAQIGCVGGAVLVSAYQQLIKNAGFRDVAVTPKPDYVAALVEAGDPLYTQIADQLPDGATPADFITSLDVIAYKA
jgi:ubiquinone/menaquinone biosynthesis C-methylase UbiE